MCWRSSVGEQLICNQPVGGSNPFASSIKKFLSIGDLKEMYSRWGGSRAAKGGRL